MPAFLRRKSWQLLIALAALWLAVAPVAAAETKTPIYVVLWFDTEDYLLPASDDAALKIADFLTHQRIRATFKVVGEKARTLERRDRQDVIAALKKHEIGYHSNYHSVQPSPALYLANLGWDEGVAEFDRRERPGYDDVKRLFGAAPSCYGQPGTSWAPQVYGTLRQWGMGVYLDAGSHVGLNNKPCYYSGVLTLYQLEHQQRTKLGGPLDLEEAEQRFVESRKRLLDEGGGLVSIYYHPCEFVHKEFWDGVNFRGGANPPRAQWKLPAAKTPAEVKIAYETFEGYIRFLQRFPEVKFITASEAGHIWADKAQGRSFTLAELRTIAAAVSGNVTFQQQEGYTLAASEVFALLNDYVAEKAAGRAAGSISLRSTPFGPTSPVTPLTGPVTTDWSQFARTAADVADCIRKRGRIPTSIWLGSTPVPPESYLVALAQVTQQLLDGKAPEQVELKPARLATAAHVAVDNPTLWTWVIFPKGFRAPAMMELAGRQAWTLKPAVMGPARAEPVGEK